MQLCAGQLRGHRRGQGRRLPSPRERRQLDLYLHLHANHAQDQGDGGSRCHRP